MKSMLFAVVAVAAAVSVLAAAPKRDAYDIRPDAARKGEAPAAEKWQADHRAELAAATAPEALAAFVESRENAMALLAQVKPAYATDPLVAFRIAAVSQYVMTARKCPLAFWKDHPRKVWASALLATARAARDPYVVQFMLDQLRWCGCPRQAKAVGQFKAHGDPSVAGLAAIVEAELNAAAR